MTHWGRSVLAFCHLVGGRRAGPDDDNGAVGASSRLRPREASMSLASSDRSLLSARSVGVLGALVAAPVANWLISDVFTVDRWMALKPFLNNLEEFVII